MIEDFFRELIEESLDGRDISAEVRVYLVGVLSQAPTPSDETVVMRVLGGRSPRIVVLKEAGDEALFVSGFFPEWLRRRGLAPRYYASLGSSAYGELAGLFPPSTGSLFREMSRKFPVLQDALGDVRSSCWMGRGDIRTALDEWLRTRSRASERRLASLGMSMVAGGDA